MPVWLLLWLFLLAMNLAAFAAFGIDKRRAIERRWRVPESNLLFLALVGGTGGAWLGRWYFRHKTRKASFSGALAVVTVTQMAILVWLFTHP